LNYVIGLARAAETAGVRIFEGTPVLEIDVSGVRKRIQTPNARVRAGHVVLAANAQLGALMPQLAATLMPVTTYVMETEPIEGLADVVRYHGAVSDTDRLDNHYRVVGGDRLQWSGRMTVREVDPKRFARGLSRSVGRIFPQLDAIKVAHIWSGTFGRTLHHMPQIGEIEPGLWVASGFGRHGLNTTALAGELVARGIVEKDQTWRLFAPYELVWAGGKFFRAVAQTIYVATRPAVQLREAFARQRERRQKRRAARAVAAAAASVSKSVKVKAADPVPPAKPAPSRAARSKADPTATLLPTPALLPDGDEKRPADKRAKPHKRSPQ
jgi:hypothetical protein